MTDSQYLATYIAKAGRSIVGVQGPWGSREAQSRGALGGGAGSEHLWAVGLDLDPRSATYSS